MLSRFTREQITVALSGDGGDELFAGYDPFEALTIAGHYARLVPAGIHKSIWRLADTLLPMKESHCLRSSFARRMRKHSGSTMTRWPMPTWPSRLSPYRRVPGLSESCPAGRRSSVEPGHGCRDLLRPGRSLPRVSAGLCTVVAPALLIGRIVSCRLFSFPVPPTWYPSAWSWRSPAPPCHSCTRCARALDRCAHAHRPCSA